MMDEPPRPTVVAKLKADAVAVDLASHRCGVCGFIVEIRNGKAVHSANALSAIAKKYVIAHEPTDGGTPRRDSPRGPIA